MRVSGWESNQRANRDVCYRLGEQQRDLEGVCECMSFYRWGGHVQVPQETFFFVVLLTLRDELVALRCCVGELVEQNGAAHCHQNCALPGYPTLGQDACQTIMASWDSRIDIVLREVTGRSDERRR